MLPRFIDTAISIAVLPGDSADEVRTKRLITGALWLTFPISTISIYQMAVVFDSPIAALVLVGNEIVMAALIVSLWKRPATYPGVMHPLALSTIVVSTALVVMAGGLIESGFSIVWAILAVLAAVAVFADHRATIWLVVALIAVISATIAAPNVEPLYEIPYPEYAAAFNFVVSIAFVYFIMFYFVRQRAELLGESDSLLRNILPDAIADQLKSSGDTIAARIDECSIMFIDIVDFTPLSASMAPEDVVGLLDEVFSLFDDLVLERGLEKIKTIGDAYMVAAGVPEPRSDHAVVLCDLALAISESVADRSFRGQSVTFRTGINSGPVVAGVIGHHKFSYDLWGDAVNTASRMESQGSMGRIQITEATKTLVEENYRCEPAGTVDVKGKGPMPVWHLSRE